MVIKRSSLLAANHLQSFHASLSASQSSTSPSCRHRGTQGTRPSQCFQYGYATIAGDSSDKGHSDPAEKAEPEPAHVWPEPHKGQNSPTPYQIFDLKHDGEYRKAHYYKLVKLYHPDLHGNGKSKDDPAHQLKMERYRLIVAAHNILSDPTKRSAYDRFGSGWNGKAEVGSRDTWGTPSPAGPFSQSWRDPNDPVWQNATWEDWERWRQHRDSGGKTKTPPVYMANSYFLAAIVALAIIGSSLNGKRASEAGSYLVEQRDIVHDRAAKELRKVRQEANGMTNRQDRIDFFVRQREATQDTRGYQDLQEEKASRVLKDREICASDNISES
ncbi:uncharacterized protein MYCFIDRAFT_212535 [Pseudocercospora fijiensis CIRAD86]|uniref:J domain-containing protein n=1 Tax=Pseudocercospora fijiensis (strain CIRAD86) TaxID=383855 RepID=M3AKL6_PSEFD|nr:uncharacterized protein MYCFIDRAFT_212535 [Pseudocercospora fijiensis CIRAD86]EME77693.1 hypothetical protein MYCFIDRAFT_212535 [Pseudocercospora fijiensis CIRAD86]